MTAKSASCAAGIHARTATICPKPPDSSEVSAWEGSARRRDLGVTLAFVVLIGTAACRAQLLSPGLQRPESGPDQEDADGSEACRCEDCTQSPRPDA